MFKKQTRIDLINKRIQNLIFSAYYYAEDQEHCKPIPAIQVKPAKKAISVNTPALNAGKLPEVPKRYT